MKASAVTDAVPAPTPTSKERPEAAARLLQRLHYALNAREQAADTDVDKRLHDQPTFGTLTSFNTITSTPQASEQAVPPALADELLVLLERLSTRVYVGEQRVLLTLESALPGAAAEIVRQGAHLVIRLHASNVTAFRTLLAQRDALETMLKKHQLSHVAIEVMPVGGVAHERRD